MNRLPPAWVVRPLLAMRDAICRLHDGIVPPEAVLLERNVGLLDTKSLAVVADLGIADLLKDQPADAATLASAVNANADALDRVLRFLVSRGVFRRGRDRRYRNNRVSQLLRSDRDNSMRDWSRFFGASWHVDIWNHLDHSVTTGKSAADAAFGEPFWPYVTETDPRAGALFDAAMANMSRIQIQVVPQKHDFSRCREVPR